MQNAITQLMGSGVLAVVLLMGTACNGEGPKTAVSEPACKIENTVPSTNQVRNDGHVVYLPAKDAPGLRVLFLGNSITLHGVRPEVGWYGNWGMAASAPEKDYVHLVLKQLRADGTPVAGCIAQLSDWEREFWDDTILPKYYQEARDWKPQVIICRLGENITTEGMQAHDLKPAWLKMLQYFNPDGKARIILTDVFSPNATKEEVIRQVAVELKLTVVNISDLGRQDKMSAIGKFKHAGVASHPGDEGMAAIADAILKQIAATRPPCQ